jgi:integrase
MGEIVTLPGAAAGAAKTGHWEKWDGGRKWIDADGRATYYVRKRVGGKRYEVRTSATTERAAFEQLKRFEADPEGYDPRGEVKAEPIYLDEHLSQGFLDWSLRPRREGGAGNTPRWVGQQRLYLATWAEALAGVDLRRASLADNIMPALNGATCRPQRIAVLKRLYSWLRKVEQRIRREEDPTLDTLAVPQYEPAQQRKVKARTKAEIAAVMKHAPARWRDLLTVLAATGAHVSELERFAKSGAVEPLPRAAKAKGIAGVLVLPATKAGGAHRVPVSAPALAAAKRVLEAGSFDRVKLTAVMKEACVKAKIPAMTPGVLRHSVATHAMNAGATLGEIAGFLHHLDGRTTRRWYATLGTPGKIPTPV